MTDRRVGHAAVVVVSACVMIGAIASTASGGSQDRWSFIPEAPALLRLPGESADLHLWLGCILVRCRPSATAYVRSTTSEPFRPLRLVRQHDGSYLVRVPATISKAPRGFEYYIAAHDSTSHQQASYPIGGAAAAKRSFLLSRPTVVDLGPARVAAIRAPDRRVVSVAWGKRPGEVGLADMEAGYEGVSAFDVSRTGSVWLLDQVNRRALRFSSAAGSKAIPLAIAGVRSALAVGRDGEIYVLEDGRYVLREFTPAGRTVASLGVPDDMATGIRVLPTGVYTQLEPSEQWAPLIRRNAALDQRSVIAGVVAGEPLADGRQVVVWARRDVRVALLAGNGVVERSWRVVGAAAATGLELAEPVGDKLVLVLDVSNGKQSGYEVVVLQGRHVVERFSVPRQVWTDPEPGGEFKLVGSSLYHMGSTKHGVFVDRYTLTR